MEKIKCPICNYSWTKELFKARSRIKISDQDFGIRKCLNCEIVFTFPALNWVEVEKFYPEAYPWKKEYKTRNIFIKLFREVENKYSQYILKYDTKRLLKFIGKSKKGRILDVGCGNGLRLETFKKEGFNQCCGIEPLKESVDYAKEVKNLPVIQKTLDEFNCSKNSFDIITLYHVFEHLHNPIHHLKILNKNLNSGGWLVIQIPNFNSWQAKLFKERWAGLSIPCHYFHYTPKTINNLLSQNGFKVKTIDHRLNFLRPFFWGFSFSKINPHVIWRKEEKGERIIFCRIWWTLLMLLSIIPTELENFSGEGGHMTIYAQKQ